jgi:hypothetical protein
VFLQVWRGGQTDAMTGPDHSTGGGDVEQMDRGTRSHTAQGRTRSGYSSLIITFYNDNVYNISPYTPVPTKALLQEVNVKMIDLKMHECWKVKKSTGKQQAGGDLSARA